MPKRFDATSSNRLALRWMPGLGCVLVFVALVLGGCAGGGVPRGDIQTASDTSKTQQRANIRFQLAAEYYGQGQLTTALDELKQALAIDPNLPQAHNLRALIYADLGDDALADGSFQAAVRGDPRIAGEAMHNYGWFLCQRGRYPAAQAQFQAALQNSYYREVVKTLLTQGVCYQRGGELPQAVLTLARAYEMDSGNPFVAVNYANALFKSGAHVRALDVIRRVNQKTDFASAQTLWLEIKIQRALGNRSEMQDLIYQLRQRYPDSRELRAFEQGKFDE